jgi:hypothetical protein
MCNALNTTRGNVAGAVLGRRMPGFFALSNRKPTTRRKCQFGITYRVVSERSFCDKALTLRIRGKAATPLLLAQWQAIEDEYLQAIIRRFSGILRSSRGILLSSRERLVIEVYERGDPNEILKKLIWPRIRFSYSSEATLERDYPGLAGFIDRQRNGAPDENGAFNGRILPRGGSLRAALKAVCRRDWLKTVAPNLQRNGSLQQRAAG